jgi:hypothetical protein
MRPTAGVEAGAKTAPSPFRLTGELLCSKCPEVKRLLIASIERARQVNPDRLTNPARSLEQYEDFVSWTERAIPGNLLEERGALVARLFEENPI